MSTFESKVKNVDLTSRKQETNMVTHEVIELKPRSLYPEWREFACGCGAAFINITITYPINKLIFRQMLHGVKVHSAFRELRNEGLRYLYRGILPPLLQKSVSLSIMFGVYEESRRVLVRTHLNNHVVRALSGLIAGSVEAVFTPLERIQTLLQDSAYHQNFRNTFHAFKEIGLRYGLKEYYRGVHTILLRNGPANVCFFIAREELQYYIPYTDSTITRTLLQFICGATIGACISCLFYPLNVAKVAIQSHLGGQYRTIFTVLPMVYRERGSKLRFVYRGVHANCTRSFLSWGVMNAAYENLKKVIY
ncbi:Mitochondrial carrier protein [Popillia japonica]|uniref:Mitochondrial carrier protein n=1 Tax=Popillia japonica TaxID=7064 RepID=A0AAW1IV13_POPJA